MPIDIRPATLQRDEFPVFLGVEKSSYAWISQLQELYFATNTGRKPPCPKKMRLIFLTPLLISIVLISSCGRTDCITTSTMVGVYFTGYESDSGVKVIRTQFE